MANTAELNIFFRGPEGLKQHIKLSFDDDVDETGEPIYAANRAASASQTITAALIAGGATPDEVRGYGGPATGGSAQTGQTPPTAAPGGAAKVHQQCGQPMQYVQAGVSKAGRAYSAFWKCTAGCLGSNGRQATVNA